MHKRTGFTLVELLVVISVIVLLLGILLPTLQRGRENARAVVCQSNLSQWGLLFAMLANDNDGRLIDRSDWEQCRTQQFAYYIDNFNYETFCPSATRLTSPTGAGGTFMAWYCPRHTYRAGSYGLNGYSPTYSESRMSSSRSAEQGWKNVFQKGTNNIPVMLDCALWAGYPKSTDAPAASEDQAATDPSVSVNSNGMRPFNINRHNGYINSLFMDWSVRRIGIKQLWTLKWHPDFDTAGPWTSANGVQSEDWPEWMRNFKEY